MKKILTILAYVALITVAFILTALIITNESQQGYSQKAVIIGKEPIPIPHYDNEDTFTTTAYCSCEICCDEWADGYTYTGTKATEGRTIAVDPDVIPLGSEVEIDGHVYIAEDIGGAIGGNRSDIYFSDHQSAIEFGRKEGVRVRW